MTKNNSIIKKLLIFVASGLAVIYILSLSFIGCPSPGSWKCGPSASASVDAFLTALSNGDEQTALGYAYNCENLGLSGQLKEEYLPIYNELCSGRTWEIISEDQLSSNFCSVTLLCSQLDISLLEQRLAELVLEEVYKQSAEGKRFVDDEDYDKVIFEVLEQLSDDFSKFYSQKELTIELVFSSGRWQLVLDNELYGYLIGDR